MRSINSIKKSLTPTNILFYILFGSIILGGLYYIVYTIWTSPLISPVTNTPKIIRYIGSSSETIAFQKEIDINPLGSYITSDGFGIIYYYASFSSNYFDKTIASFDIVKGSFKWKVSPSPNDSEKGGIASLTYGNGMLYEATSEGINAYDCENGNLIWWTKLGYGHVGNTIQLLNSIIQVYYGDNVIELNAATGKEISSKKYQDLIWIEDNIEIFNSSPKIWGMVAKDKSTGMELWNSNEKEIVIGNEYLPQKYNSHLLIVPVDGSEYCSLDLLTGSYIWCRSEKYLSNIAIDTNKHLGYILQNDLSLLIINMDNGKISGKIQFLPQEVFDPMDYEFVEFYITFYEDQIIVVFGDSGQIFALKTN
jgi:outer membrane protein assembly factor BamB